MLASLESSLMYAGRNTLRNIVKMPTKSKGAICKTIRVKERGKTLFVRLNNCKFDRNFSKGKSNSITSKKYFIDLN